MLLQMNSGHNECNVIFFSGVRASTPVPPASPAAGASRQASPTPSAPRSPKVVVRRGKNRQLLPPVIRVPKSQKTPLVDDLLKQVRRCRNEANTMRKKYLDKCQEVRSLKKVTAEDALARLPQGPGAAAVLQAAEDGGEELQSAPQLTQLVS